MSFIPEVPAPQPQVPRERLPATGELFTKGTTRYLVISTWDQLEVGEREAARLNAQLVAPEIT